MNHLFGVEMFARFAGTRTQAMLDSPFFSNLDRAHGHALSALTAAEAMDHGAEPVGLQSKARREPSPFSPRQSETGRELPSLSPTPILHDSAVDPDPTDEEMTGAGDSLTLLFALFVDGVQLHAHGRATTTVVGIKCLDLPGFLCNTDLACYTLAFIGGAKEPSNLSQFMEKILEEFKRHEPSGSRDAEGVPLYLSRYVLCMGLCISLPYYLLLFRLLQISINRVFRA